MDTKVNTAQEWTICFSDVPNCMKWHTMKKNGGHKSNF